MSSPTNRKNWQRATRKYKYKVRYGITIEDFDKLLEKQNGLCAICQSPPSDCNRGNHTLHVDHDHTTGEVRGLLCFRCNRAIGLFGENISNIDAASAYLKSYWRSYFKGK